MAYAISSAATGGQPVLAPDAQSVKILIAGGFGTGKTTLVEAVSETPTLRTEEHITVASTGIDDLVGVEGKISTTVAMDFGRITLSSSLVVYLFGTPGQDRFWFMWDDLSRGALGAVVLVDTRRLESSFAAVDFFESRSIPFMVGINCFEGHPVEEIDEVRSALDLSPETPVVYCDARERASVKPLLLALLEHVLEGLTGPPALSRHAISQQATRQPDHVRSGRPFALPADGRHGGQIQR